MTYRVHIDNAADISAAAGGGTILDLANSDPAAVAIVDGNGDQITSFGGGTQYTEGDTDASITGTACLMEIAGNELRPIPGSVADGQLVNLGSNNDVVISDGGNSITVDNGGTFAVQVSSIAAGNNNIGDVDVASIAAGDNNIGNVDIVTMPAVTNAGTFAVQVDGAALTALQLIDNPVLVDDAAFTPATSSVMMAGFQADESSTDSVNEGDAGAARMTLDRKVIVSNQAHTAGGALPYKSLDLDESEEEVKASAGQVYGFIATNRRTSPLFLKFYNDTAANVAVGTTVPVITIEIPANATDHTAFIANFPVGVQFDTAICIAATTGFADNDTGAPGANEMIITVFYK